jgi:hypothetical protein
MGQLATPIRRDPLLKYCAWCGAYQGMTEGQGYQIRRNMCEIDTSTICSPCHDKVVEEHQQQLQRLKLA